jgi:hypothetical protein
MPLVEGSLMEASTPRKPRKPTLQRLPPRKEPVPSTQHFDWRRLRVEGAPRCDNKVWRDELTAMVLVDNRLKEEGRRVCKTNLLALCYVLGYCLITEDVHREALAFFPEIDGDNKMVEEIAIGLKRRRSLIYPRNTYKTTIDLAFCVMLILHYYETIAILILSGSKELAFAFVDEVASFFTQRLTQRGPTLFQALFPELCVTASRTSSGQFTAAIRQVEPEIIEPLIWGNSVESATTGWHPDILIIDDIHTNRNSNTYQARERITKAYKLVRKILKPTGIELKIGTPYGVHDIFNDETLTARPGSYDRVYKPAMRLLSGMRLDANGFPAEEEIELLFPSILNYDFLREEYEADYQSFMSQYMLDTYGAEEIVFDEGEIIGAMVDETKVPLEGTPKLVFRLPCRSLKWQKTSGAVGLLHRDRVFIVDVLQGHHKPSGIARVVHDLARKYGTHSVSIIESPGAISFDPAIRDYALNSGWEINITWIPFEEDAGLRDTHIRSVEAAIASGRLLFSTGVKTKPLITGFMEYGMIDETGLPEVISYIADSLPASHHTHDRADELAWQMMRERDHYNLVYNRPPYAPPEPEPEEEPEPEIEDLKVGSNGLEIQIPGLEY